jgi:hypothetical protein
MTAAMNNVVKFPYSISRRAHVRRARRSKNGTPEPGVHSSWVPFGEQRARAQVRVSKVNRMSTNRSYNSHWPFEWGSRV